MENIKKIADKIKRLYKNNAPRYLRIYDNRGTERETLDCYTIVFTRRNDDFAFNYISASVTGAGVYLRLQSYGVHVDRPSYRHLGKRVAFDTLDKGLQDLVIKDYNFIWGLEKFPPWELTELGLWRIDGALAFFSLGTSTIKTDGTILYNAFNKVA